MFDFDMSAGILSGLLDNSFEKLAPQILEEAAPILKQSTQEAIRAEISHTGDSELVNSLKETKPKLTKTDACVITVTPKGYSRKTFSRGKRKYPVSNALKAIWLEYGNRGGAQAPRPWLDKAASAHRSEIEAKMQETYNRLTGANQ